MVTCASTSTAARPRRRVVRDRRHAARCSRPMARFEFELVDPLAAAAEVDGRAGRPVGADARQGHQGRASRPATKVQARRRPGRPGSHEDGAQDHGARRRHGRGRALPRRRPGQGGGGAAVLRRGGRREPLSGPRPHGRGRTARRAAERGQDGAGGRQDRADRAARPTPGCRRSRPAASSRRNGCRRWPTPPRYWPASSASPASAIPCWCRT